MTLISASIPAPPDGSDPAIVRTRGIELDFESDILRLSMVDLFINSEFVGGGTGGLASAFVLYSRSILGRYNFGYYAALGRGISKMISLERMRFVCLAGLQLVAEFT